MKTIHGLVLGLAALAAGLPQLEAAFPANATPYLKAAQAVIIVVVGVLGAIDPPDSSILSRKP